MSYGHRLEIGEFKQVLNSSDKSLSFEYHQIFQSFAKRVQYCDIYFSEFAKVTTPEAISHDYETDVFGSKEPVIDYRLYYEAHALAFLQNVHALCDTVPYAIKIILFKDNSDTEIKWDKDLIARVKKKFPNDKEFSSALSKFMKNDDFLRLKGYVNKAKHQYLVTILNTDKELKFSNFTYKRYSGKKRTRIAENENVEKFMLRMHEKLIGELFHIYKYMYQLI